MKTPQVPALSGMTPLGLPDTKNSTTPNASIGEANRDANRFIPGLGFVPNYTVAGLQAALTVVVDEAFKKVSDMDKNADCLTHNPERALEAHTALIAAFKVAAAHASQSARIAELEGALRECSDLLGIAAGGAPEPVFRRRMDAVNAARSLLAKKEG